MADSNRVIDAEASLSSATAKSAVVEMAYSYAEQAQVSAVEALSAARSAGQNVDRSEAVLEQVQRAVSEIEELILNGGLPGAKGEPGDSSYDIAVRNGYEGSEAQWLETIRGADGAAGRSAYEDAVATGAFTGSLSQYLESLKGEKGDKGEDGTDGTAATVSVGSVVAGTEPQVRNVGTPQNAILEFTLVKGDKGDKGDPGTKGADGTAATLSLGTVTVGTVAAVTMTGTPQARVLNFVMQAGPRGEQGLRGEPGRGIPVGGTVGQVLVKSSTSNYEAQWQDFPQQTSNGEDTVLRNRLSTGAEGTVNAGAVAYQLPDGGGVVSITSALNDVFTDGRLLKTPADIVAFLDALRQTVPPSTGNNTRSVSSSRKLKMNVGPGRFDFSSDLLIDFDGLDMAGAGQGVTELRFDNASKFQIGVDADTNLGIKNVKSFKLRDMTITSAGAAKPMLNDTMPDGVVSIRMMAWSSLENLYIKNYSGQNDTGGMYLSGYQWVDFENVNIESFGRYCLMLDSQSPETWEVLAKFKDCEMVMGSAAAEGVSASVYVYQSGRFRNSNFSALGVSFSNCHLALYPSDQDNSKDTRAFYIDPTLNGVDLAFAFTDDCLFENHMHFIEAAKDGTYYFQRPKFYGNSVTQEIVRMDNYQGKWTFDSPFIVNCASGFRQLGITTFLGSGKVSGVPAELFLRPNGNLRIFGNMAGYSHDFVKEFNQLTAGGPVAGSTTWTLTGMGLQDKPARLEIQTSWGTTVAYHLGAGSTTGDQIVINFGTAVPAAFNIRVFASITHY